ncbi:hypothetical protein MMC21_007740 [Puttea exsequens]|nr:hypothetical protein [Puttea exsequens]
MVQYFPPPDYRSLLPPLLACLPTSFVSPRPPPAVLPLLTPILRQRVQLLAATATSSSDSWLSLLCWESDNALHLVDIVSESDAFELHPVSGEIDFGDVEAILYTRLDEETLQSKISLPDMGIIVIYLWCEGDEEGGGSGWRVSEVKPFESDNEDKMTAWATSIDSADEQAKERMMEDALRHGEKNPIIQEASRDQPTSQSSGNDDDDYWAQYDATPDRTPAAKSPAPPSDSNRHNRSASEAAYYSQYEQVQPEMDNDDPSTDPQSIGASSLNGNAIVSSGALPTNHDRYLGQDASELPNGNASANDSTQPVLSSPRPRSTTITRLEDSADIQSAAEVAIKQHVSTSLKSLFRLCRNAGIERADFAQMVKMELETLSLIAEDD